MTFLEMQFNFEQKIRNHIFKDLDIRTIDVEFYLNSGYDAYIEDWYKIFETSEAARKRLNPLVGYYATGTSVAGAHTNGRYFTIPSNVKYILQEEATLSYTNCHGEPAVYVAEVKPVKLDYYNKHKRNPFKKPYLKLVWRLDIGGGIKQHELIHGSDVNSITQYQITYLANVAAITLLSGTPQTSSVVLSEEFHEEIVDRAIEVALQTFQLNKSLKSNN